MNKTKGKKDVKIFEPKLKDETEKLISTHNIIPSGRSFVREDKKQWIEKFNLMNKEPQNSDENKHIDKTDEEV